MAFPNEILELIIGNLKGEHNTLLNCRLVSKAMKVIGEKVLNENASLWAPVMEDDFPSFIKRVNGTRFSKAEEVNLFLREMESCRNPFPNGTVIFCPEIGCENVQNDDFFKTFSTLVSTHKDNIKRLVCAFNNSLESVKTQVESVLRLRNLQSLAVCVIPCVNMQTRDDFGTEWFNRMADFKLEFVKEFIMFGEKNIDRTGMTSLSPVRALLTSVLNSVKRLRFHHDDQWEMEWKCLKLESLELSGFRKEEFCWVEGIYEIPLLKVENSPNLREISVRFLNNPFTTGGLAPSLEHLFNLLNSHSEKLERLFLCVDKNTLFCNPNPAVLVEDGQTFPKLKGFTLHYNTCMKWRNLVGFCKQKFPNLEEVTILIGSEEGGDEREYNENLRGLWELLPDKVRVIRVPHFGWELRRNLAI